MNDAASVDAGATQTSSTDWPVASARVRPSTLALLDALAKVRGTTRQDVIRGAIEKELVDEFNRAA